MAKIKMRNNVRSDKKVSWKFKVETLNLFFKYAVSSETKLPELNKMKKLFDQLDIDTYKFNVDIYNRVQLIRTYLIARCTLMLSDIEAIKMYIVNADKDLSDLVNEMDWSPNQIAPTDARMIAQSIIEKLLYSSIMANKDDIVDGFDKLEHAEIYSISAEVTKMRELFSQTLTEMQNASIGSGMVRSLSFTDPSYTDTLTTIVAKEQEPGAVLYTGIRQLNAILSPGFQSRRLYTFLGNSGGFKSGTLLNMADQICHFNPQILKDTNNRRKTVLYVTMENSVNETLVRLYDMYSPVGTDLRYATVNDVIKTLHDEGGYPSINEPGIDLHMLYYADMELSTQGIYNIIQNENDSGRDVICLIVDYLKKLDSPRNWNGDERIRLGYVTRELKAIAEFFNIPVITAMQTNREANSIIDAAIREEKTDIARFVGASNVGSAWSIIEESDWVALINREWRKSDNQLYITFNRFKIRGKNDASISPYFNHPFTNEKYIRFLPDVNLPFSQSIRSLASDLEYVDEKRFNRTQDRPKLTMLRGTGSGGPKSADKVLEEVGLEAIAI